MSEGSILTFYSYKGGVGRSLVLANAGALLASWGYKVLCVDWDLEAPGLHVYFRKWIEKEQPGLTELIQNYRDGEEPDWRRFITTVHFSESEEPLALMVAGIQDSSYAQRIQSLNWTALYERTDFGNFLERLRQDWKQEFDFVLVDSRTGLSDISGICTIQLPDILVAFFTTNEQSLEGAIDIANRAIQSQHLLPFDRSKLLVLPIPSRFEGRNEYKLAQTWLTVFAEKLEPFYRDWAHRNVTPEALLEQIKVPYVSYWSSGEQLPVLEENPRSPGTISFSLEAIAALIAHQLASSELLICDRSSFVAQAEKQHSVKSVKQDDRWTTVERFLDALGVTPNAIQILEVVEVEV